MIQLPIALPGIGSDGGSATHDSSSSFSTNPNMGFAVEFPLDHGLETQNCGANEDNT